MSFKTTLSHVLRVELKALHQQIVLVGFGLVISEVQKFTLSFDNVSGRVIISNPEPQFLFPKRYTQTREPRHLNNVQTVKP